MPNPVQIQNPFQKYPGFNCFACGPSHPFGLKLKFYQFENHVEAKTPAPEQFTGIPSLIHGGLLATLLDEIMWWTIFGFQQRFCLTQNMQTEFHAPVRINTQLRCVGQIEKRERNKVWAKGEVFTNDRLAASAQGEYFLPNAALLARILKTKPNTWPAELLTYLKD